MPEVAGEVDVAIVGAGFCGTTLALRLAERREIRTALFERNAFARGVAYSTQSERHILNLTTARMGPFPETPDAFTQWLDGAHPTQYVPRRNFARFLRSLLDDALKRAPSLTTHAAAVVSIVPQDGRFAVTSERETIVARYVVLAVGNFAPGDDFLPDAIRSDPNYFANPWTLPYDTLSGDVLLIGDGLTAMDVLVELHHRAYAGKVTMLSRHGRRPETHKEYGDPVDVALDRTNARTMVRSTRRAVAEVERKGGDWRAVVDGIRPLTQAIWHAWPHAEHMRFIRHARPFWEASRRRIPPEVAAVVEAATSSGRLAQIAGRIRTIEKTPAGRFRVTLARKGDMATLEACAIVNCTGPQVDVRRIDDALVRSLLEEGAIVPHPTRIGIQANADGSIVDASGNARGNFFALGSLMRGALYETIAVPELRVSVKALADKLIAELAP